MRNGWGNVKVARCCETVKKEEVTLGETCNAVEIGSLGRMEGLRVMTIAGVGSVNAENGDPQPGRLLQRPAASSKNPTCRAFDVFASWCLQKQKRRQIQDGWCKAIMREDAGPSIVGSGIWEGEREGPTGGGQEPAEELHADSVSRQVVNVRGIVKTAGKSKEG